MAEKRKGLSTESEEEKEEEAVRLGSVEELGSLWGMWKSFSPRSHVVGATQGPRSDAIVSPQPRGPPFCFVNTASSDPPQALCTCCTPA